MGLARFIGLSQSADVPPHAARNAAERAVSLCHHLLSESGEDDRLAVEALRAYRALNPAERSAFFDRLARELSPDPQQAGLCADAYRQNPSSAHLMRLMRAAEPPHRELFRRLNTAPGGTAALVEMRRQVLAELATHPSWMAIEADLADLLAGWFNRGVLTLRRVDWHTPAAVLEKLIAYEAVHPIHGWRDLRRRLDVDRRCYALFHPALPGEPLTFVEVALVQGMSARIQPLVDPAAPVMRPESANCAVFYSITSCLEGLRGIPFGSFLIRKAAGELAREFPRIGQLATLSPIPGFVGWLRRQARAQEPSATTARLASVIRRLESPGWFENKEASAELERELSPLCADYLLESRQGHGPLDPVARFHLRNGARLERLNWLADLSPSAIERSAGMMVNYVYRLGEIARNRTRYLREHRIPASIRIERLARESRVARQAPLNLARAAVGPAF